MKKIAILIAACLILSSCGISSPSSLYYWGGTMNGTTTYEHLAYKSYDKQTPESICQLIVAYENMVSHPGGSRMVPPPGICAEYGYLLLQPETAEKFAQAATPEQKKVFERSNYDMFFKERGKELMQKEIELYPESARFIAPLVKRFAE